MDKLYKITTHGETDYQKLSDQDFKELSKHSNIEIEEVKIKIRDDSNNK